MIFELFWNQALCFLKQLLHYIFRGCGAWKDKLQKKVKDLDSAEDGEASEESHGSSDETELRVRLHSLVSLDLVKCCRVKENLD